MSAPITISLFANEVSPAATETRTVATLEELAPILETSTWSPATFKDNQRSGDNFEATTLLAFDFDKGQPIPETIGRLERLHLAAIIGTTKSHMVEKVHEGAKVSVAADGTITRTPPVTSPPCPRYRVTVQASEPITDAEVYKATWLALAARLGAVDPLPKSASNLFFPSKTVAVLKGRSVEPQQPAPKAAAGAPTEDHRADDRRGYLQTVDRAVLVKRAGAYVNGEKFPMSKSGEGGHVTLLKAAVAFVKGFGLTETEAYPQLVRFNETKASPPWPESQLRHKLEEAANTTFDTPSWNVLGFCVSDADLDEYLAARAKATAGPLKLEPPEPAWVSLDTFMEETHPPANYLCHPFITSGSLVYVTAAPGSLKTWLVFYLALAAAAGGAKVLLVLEEGRPYSIQKRFRQLGGSHKNVSVLVRKNLRIDDPQQWAAFAAGVAKRGFALVIVDPLADVHELEESDGPSMRRLINQWKKLISDTGVAVALVHHTVKSAWAGANKDRPAALLSDARGRRRPDG